MLFRQDYELQITGVYGLDQMDGLDIHIAVNAPLGHRRVPRLAITTHVNLIIFHMAVVAIGPSSVNQPMMRLSAEHNQSPENAVAVLRHCSSGCARTYRGCHPPHAQVRPRHVQSCWRQSPCPERSLRLRAQASPALRGHRAWPTCRLPASHCLLPAAGAGHMKSYQEWTTPYTVPAGAGRNHTERDSGVMGCVATFTTVLSLSGRSTEYSTGAITSSV